MNIANVHNAYNYNSYHNSAHRASRLMDHSNSVSQPTSGKDKVSLSATGIKASTDIHQAKLEELRLPSWYGQYFPEQLTIDGEMMEKAIQETRKSMEMHDKFNSDGHISHREDQILKNLQSNMPANQALRNKHEERSRLKDELFEYTQIITKYFSESLDEHGIDSNNYYEKVLQAEGDNEDIHQSFKNKLLSNSKALKLMDIIGLERPV